MFIALRNRKGGIGETANFIAVLFVAIAVLAILAPSTTTLFIQSSQNANLTGLAKIVVEYYNVVILLVLTLMLMLALWVVRGD